MLAILLLLNLADAPTTPAYKAEIEKWRSERETRLKSETGWLTVAGLFWLREGPNSIGTAESDRVQLPRNAAPASVGVIDFSGGKARLTLKPGVPATLNGKPFSSAALRADADPGGPDQVALGDLTFFVIKRGERFGVRLKDKNSEYRRNFRGLDWYAADPRWRIEAKWVPYPQPRKILVDSLSGDKQEQMVPGYAEFSAAGRTLRLEPALEGDELFFVFRDKTAGKTTYQAARFLYAKPAGGRVVLDFNKAYNPPCAFTPYATCPLPTPGNRLPIEIPAGERKYKEGDH